jgi:Asp-tRNA(Asn)/Glu-tRNA(Gln) amidotransferase A subunit family amidase
MEEAAAITDEAAADANRVRQDLRDWFSAALSRHPVLALPALIGAPPLIGERMSTTILTVPANLAGLPALVLPVPGGPARLPASLQLIGPPGGEEQLIALGYVIEAALRLQVTPVIRAIILLRSIRALWFPVLTFGRVRMSLTGRSRR